MKLRIAGVFRRSIFLVIVLALCANAGYLATRQNYASPATSLEAATFVPYTVVKSFSATAQNGKIFRPSRTAIFALRSDGTYVESQHLFGNHGYWTQVAQRTISFPSGLTIYTDDLGELKSTIQDKLGNRIRIGDPATLCLRSKTGDPLGPDKDEVLRQEPLLNHRTAVIRGGATTRWYALDLNCALLRTVTDFGAGGISEMIATHITHGEPRHDLFEVAAAYKEVPPSVRLRAQVRPGDDEKYYARRPMTVLTNNAK